MGSVGPAPGCPELDASLVEGQRDGRAIDLSSSPTWERDFEILEGGVIAFKQRASIAYL
jgi:hypothetical protein